MDQQEVIKKTQTYIKKLMSGEGTGHDWFHIERVVKNAKLIAEKEGGNVFIIELAALLHDIADWKFHEGDTLIGPQKAKEWLSKMDVPQRDINQIIEIIRHISFKGGTNNHRMTTLEGKIVQDADRLDALGAIGIARTFAFGGAFKREIYNPEIKPELYKTFDDVKKKLKTNTSVNHFYEKLLLLKNRMNTRTGRELAQKRHAFMEAFLNQFFKEWEGYF